MDMLTGYNIENVCKVCKEKFRGYAELRDHVQTHGENFREPYGHPEAYRYFLHDMTYSVTQEVSDLGWVDLYYSVSTGPQE